MERLDVLAASIQDDRDVIVRDWRERVRNLPSARHLDRPALDDNIDPLLDEISNGLLFYHDSGALPVAVTPVEHGRQRFEVGFDLHQVVIEYNMLRQVLRECAARHGISLDGVAGAVLHRIIDEDIAVSVITHSRQQASQHAAAIRERVADIVHDIKSPVSAIQTAAHILDTRLPPDARQSVATILRIILRNCDGLNAMLARLLESTALESPLLNATEINIHNLVADVIERFAPLGQRTGTRITNAVPDGATATADPFLLKQVIENLVSNALKYTDDGEITIAAAASTDRTSISVRDTGQGISKQMLTHLFTRGDGDPLRADSSGLGLAIVKKIVDAHQGEIAVESEPGHGATFTLSFPR